MRLWTKLDVGLAAWERLGKLIGATAVIVAAVGAAIYFLKEHSVAAWVPLAIGLPLLLAIAIGAYALGRGAGRELPIELAKPAAEGPEPPADRAARESLEGLVADAEYQKRLVWDALESIQQAVASEEFWELDELVERGVLGPARGLLVRDPQEDVRLAVLIPVDDPPTRFRMRWAAGHRPESVKLYERDIDRTMAGIAFRRDEFVECPNVRDDPRFEVNPKESRPFISLVSMPLRREETVVGAFTVVSTREAAFTPNDISFIKLIGAVLDVLLAFDYDTVRLGTRYESEEE